MAPEAQATRCPQCGKSFGTTVRICPDDGTVLEQESSVATQVGKVLEGKYRLDAFISKGGMGAVYRAAHIMLGKTVAVKLINQELVTSSDVVRRFQREARAATALNHPNIVGVYDMGQTQDGTLYIAMEFINGPSLKSLIESSGPVSPARTVALLRQVASALAVAHRQDIVHRDLKPHNIMLARTDEGREVAKLVDFGIAKTFDESTQLTMTGFVLGTPQYMAPEQAEGRTVDARSDLYSLGIILYEMLTGDVPFHDQSAAAILIKHMKETPVRPSLKNPTVQVPPELEAIALRCLEKDPALRFQTADEFAAALEHAAATIPGEGEAMQATVAMPGGPTPSRPAAAGGTAGKAAPTVLAQAQGARPPAADTRSTVAIAQAPELGVAQSASSNKSRVVLIMIVIVGVLGAAGILYQYQQQRSSAPTESAAAKPTIANAPVASPAMASPSVPEAPAVSTAAAPVQSAPAEPPNRGSHGTTNLARQETARSSPVASPSAPVQGASGEPSNRGSRGTTNPARQETARSTPVGKTAASPGAGPATAAPGATAAPPQAVDAARQAPPVVMPENPAVFFKCAGANEICAPLGAAVDEALDKAGLASVRNAARADIHVGATVEGMQEKVGQQFNTTFAVRTYSIQVTGEARTSEAVPMPPPTTVSFDPQFGSERAAEKARVVAGDIVDRVRAFARKKRGG